MKKEYVCHLSPSKLCEYGGNKNFNYGFMRGSSLYCRHPQGKKFIHDIVKCPKQSVDTKNTLYQGMTLE